MTTMTFVLLIALIGGLSLGVLVVGLVTISNFYLPPTTIKDRFMLIGKGLISIGVIATVLLLPTLFFGW